MHRKGPNLKLTNNKRPRCTDRKENNQGGLFTYIHIHSQPTEGGGQNTTQTQREVSCKTRKRVRTDSVSHHYVETRVKWETCMGHGKAL